MDRSRGEPSRPPTRRRPLEDASSRANIGCSPPPEQKEQARKRYYTHSPASGLPHNESIVPNGTLTVRNGVSCISPEHKRLSAVKDDERRESKRDSAVSNASTNASGTVARRKTHIGPWQLGKTIGKGGCSRVRLVRHSITNEWGAAKIISKAVAEQARAISLANLIKNAETDPSLMVNGRVIPFGLEREIVIMKLLDHPNIVKLYDVWENRNELYLIMEYVQGGELFSYIEEQNGLDEMRVVWIFRQIIAALLYCHRIHIHHRDLKPENILIDRESMTIKLVDFGMAALQPQGKFLSTPCGSPHYAAPEVLSLRHYDGSKADIWSCGVILYVMLSGILPFNYPADDRVNEHQKQVRLYKTICAGRFQMPEYFSDEAKDLISRMFVTDPIRRIPIEAIWEHPFMQKYNVEFEIKPHQRSIDYWVGPRPQIMDWAPLKREDIDREILRNMRTLWHSVEEKVLVHKLMNDEPNQEKVFYSALLRHREERLENYVGGQEMGYSASDHQHLHPPDPNDMPPLPQQAKRSKSAYSILNDEHLRQSFYGPPPSEQSYDPFRASKNPVVNVSRNYVNVTVHNPPSSSLGHRQRDSLRVEALKRGSRRSYASGTSVSLKGSPAQRHSSLMLRKSTLKSSSTRSSLWATERSSPSGFRASGAHKRGVNFSHLRRSSTASALSGRPSMDSMHSGRTPEVTPSPSVRPQHNIISRKEKGKGAQRNQLRVLNRSPSSNFIDNEARKVSTELEKYCEEAFNRSSVGSSIMNRTATTINATVYETPPSSVKPSPNFVNKASKLDRTVIEGRPLPPLPTVTVTDTPTTYTLRELAETRNKLAAKYADSGKDNAEYFQAVLSQLDNLLKPPPADHHENRRTISAPQGGKSPEGYLPPISEEERLADDTDNINNIYSSHRDWLGRRSATDPFDKRRLTYDERRVPGPDTIRMVQQSPDSPAPLNIRKVSGGSTASTPLRSVYTSDSRAASTGRVPTLNTYGSKRALTTLQDFDVHEDPQFPMDVEMKTPRVEELALRKKKSLGWFRRDKGEKEDKNTAKENSRPPVPRWQDLDDRTTKSQPVSNKHGRHPSDPASSATEFPIRNPTPATGKKGFFKFFVKTKTPKDDLGLRLASETNLSTSSSISYRDDLLEDENPSARSSGVFSNWFTRFLHIKPSTQLMCLHIGRGRARTELVRLWRDWKKHGMRDVVFDRKANIVQARLDKKNSLNLKPVSIIAELFVVLEHGRRAQLTIIRFMQERGAASSFRKILGEVEKRFSEQGFLVENEEKKRAMYDVMKQ